MSPDEEVQITLTREEAVRIHAALSALCSIQRSAPASMVAAAGLTTAVEVIEGVFPRLREAGGDLFSDEAVGVSVETKSGDQAPAFDVKISDLKGLSPEEAGAIFGSKYDPAISDILHTLIEFTDFTQEMFAELLRESADTLREVAPTPVGMTVSQSKPYVKVSDLTTLGLLAFEMYERADQVDANNLAGPF